MKHFNKAVWNSKNGFLSKYESRQKHIIYLSFSCKLWTSSKFVRLELSEKNFTFTQTRRCNTKFHGPNGTRKIAPWNIASWKIAPNPNPNPIFQRQLYRRQFFGHWPKQENNVTTMLWVDVNVEWYEDAMVFRVFIFILLFRTNGKKGHLDENDFHTVMVVIPKVPFWKLFDHSYVQSSLSIITKHIDNSILKDTLPLKILRTRIKIRSN